MATADGPSSARLGGGASLERAQGVTRLEVQAILGEGQGTSLTLYKGGSPEEAVQAIPGEGQGTSLTLYQGGSPEEAVSGESLGWTGSYLISRCWGKALPPPIS